MRSRGLRAQAADTAAPAEGRRRAEGGRVGHRRRIEARQTAERKNEEAARRIGKDVDRVAFFSDAIFAIAITLLVLRISVPPGSEALGAALADRWSSFLVFIISFWVIGRFWLLHHRLFRYVRGYDDRFIRLNLFLMLSICFVPYPTELLGSHQDDPLSVVLYAGTVIVTGASSYGLWWYAARRGFLDDELTPGQIRGARNRGLLVIVVFAISIPIAYVDTTSAMLVWMGSALQRPLDAFVARRARRR